MNKSSQYSNEYTCESIIYIYQNFKIHSTEMWYWILSWIESHYKIQIWTKDLKYWKVLLLGKFSIIMEIVLLKDRWNAKVNTWIASMCHFWKKIDSMSIFIDCRIMVHRGKHCLLYWGISYLNWHYIILSIWQQYFKEFKDKIGIWRLNFVYREGWFWCWRTKIL